MKNRSIYRRKHFTGKFTKRVQKINSTEKEYVNIISKYTSPILVKQSIYILFIVDDLSPN